MRSWKTLLAWAAIALGVTGVAFAAATATQTVTMQVAAICVLGTTGNPGALTVSAPLLGGDPPGDATSNPTYAQYTSTVAAGTTRRLQANWDASDGAPARCSLLLTATPANVGNQGASLGQITMTSTPTDLVSGIGNCATGRGPTSGAELIYVLRVDNVDNLVAGESRTVTITLTLTDN